MVSYNLRSRAKSGDQDRDGDSQRKELKISKTKKPKAKAVEPRKSRAKGETEEDVIIVDTDPEIEYRSDASPEVDNTTTPMSILLPSYMETDFYNFENIRRPNVFSEGQIWAIYDEYGLPRRYVEIGNMSLNTGSINVSCLKHSSSTQEQAEEQNNYKGTSWTLAVCGSFTTYSMGLSIGIHSFSHMVFPLSQTRNGRCVHDIYPKLGDVWAMYKDGKITSPRLQKYQLIEIVSEFGRQGGRAVYLVKLEGGIRSVFKRLQKDDVDVSLQIGPENLAWFSHHIPASRVLFMGSILPAGCLELDPASLPFYIDDFTDAAEPKISSKFLSMKVLDCKSLMMKETLKEKSVWAVYDDCDVLPRRYVVADITSDRGDITWLGACPVTEDEKKWCKAGLPIACGDFRLKKTTMTVDHSMFSHPVQCDWDADSQQYTIYPRKGEVWAMYRDWEMGWSSDPRRGGQHSNFEYEFVEMLTNFNKNEGAEVVPLKNLRAFGCVFRRLVNGMGVEFCFHVNGNESYRFSHQIQDYKIHEIEGVGNGCRILDPLVVFQNARGSAYLIENPKDNDVEADKDGSKLLPGQIWALYEDPDHMPRSYAIVCNTLSHVPKVEVRMLKPCPVSEDEMEWVENNLPISWGTFRAEKETTIKKRWEFSHQITLRDDGKKQNFLYRIIPQMSEVWAVCQNRHPVSEGKQQRYQTVEIVSSFNEESGLSVSPLFASGSNTIFRRHSIGGFELVKKYSKKEMLQLSHRIPASSILGNGGEVLIGHWKLDSAALPPESSLL
ncbi:hypothetical protein AAG906_037090 [Vitis piasezkii]